jgi:hypothetical protein
MTAPTVLLDSAPVTAKLDRCDAALLAALALAAILGTWTSVLMVNDGAVFLGTGWFDNSWELYFSQNADRWLATYVTYGPAWVGRHLLGLSARAYMITAHVSYFAVPFVLWLVLRRIETHRLFSRLYLAIVLPLLYFPTELILGLGLWAIWLAMLCDPARSNRQAAIVTVVFAVLLAFVHAAIGLMSLLYLAVGVLLGALGRPVPRRSLIGAGAMAVVLLAGYFVAGHWLKATNPRVLAAFAVNRYAYIDPSWMLATMALFPALAAQWLLLLAPGTQGARLRWRIAPRAIAVIAGFGVVSAALGTGLLTSVYARHTAAYIMALAAVLALVAPMAWLAPARQALLAYAVVAGTAIVSYNIDLFFFGRFTDRYAAPGLVDIDDPGNGWPVATNENSGRRTYLKWFAGADYARDVAVPIYDWHRLALAFYSYFRTDRRTVLYHHLDRPGDWLPFPCRVVARTLAETDDPQDRMFLAFFLEQKYCVP